MTLAVYTGTLIVFVLVTLAIAGLIVRWLNQRVSGVESKPIQVTLRIVLWVIALVAFLILASPLFLTSSGG
jgi:hypothetical protein